MLHLLQDFLVAAESPDLNGFEVGPPLPLLPPTLAASAMAALTKMLVALGEEEAGVKEWICQLPAATREQLMPELEETKAKMPGRSAYLQLLERSWRLLFTPDWRRVTVRNLGMQVQNKFKLASNLSAVLLDRDGLSRSIGRGERPPAAACKLSSPRTLWTST